jgi:hypothetical protein
MSKPILKDLQYIMVTNWARHWDQLDRWKNSTLFTAAYIRPSLITPPWPEEAVTLFIKLNKEDNLFEESWIGKSMGFRKDLYKERNAVRFEVSDLESVECPPEYKDYPLGWHLYNQGQEEGNLQPPFFRDMETCDWQTFEIYCANLLRLIGIHDLHTIPPTDNRGKADGFFKFYNLSVIYDTTINPEFAERKHQQLENYVNQLKTDKVEFDKKKYTITDTVKQVWIITRSERVKALEDVDHIEIKEIPYQKLINIYLKRLKKDVNILSLVDLLKDLS